MKYLVVIDFQNDFITGSLANKEAAKLVSPMADMIRNFDGQVILTMDVHNLNYMNTQEGKILPIEHCITEQGILPPEEIIEAVQSRNEDDTTAIEKHTFGTLDWQSFSISPDDEIYICGLCTDICVITNALILKTLFPETEIRVIEDLCAGTSVENHNAALNVMFACQVRGIKMCAMEEV